MRQAFFEVTRDNAKGMLGKWLDKVPIDDRTDGGHG